MTRRIQYRGDLEAEWASYERGHQGDRGGVRLGRERLGRARARAPPRSFVLAGWKPGAVGARGSAQPHRRVRRERRRARRDRRARLVTAVGLARANVLLASDRPVVVPSGLDVTTISAVIADVIRRAGTPPFFMGLAAPVRRSAPTAGAASSNGGGRNCATAWTIRLARYLVHLTAPGWNVIGATAPWRPGVAVGTQRSRRMGRGRARRRYAGCLRRKAEPGEPASGRGPGSMGRDDADHDADRDSRQPEAVSLRKRVHPPRGGRRLGSRTPSRVYRAVERRRTGRGRRPGGAGARPRHLVAGIRGGRRTRWKMPARRFTYADADGRRESLAAALVPVRRGWNGALPAPGWTGAFEWTGWQTRPRHGAGDAACGVGGRAVRARASRSRGRCCCRALADAGVGSAIH